MNIRQKDYRPRIRMAWKHTMFDGKVCEGKGFAYLDTEIRRMELARTVDFANQHHGKGTHWIESVS